MSILKHIIAPHIYIDATASTDILFSVHSNLPSIKTAGYRPRLTEERRDSRL
jgi:hypothetical protein